MKKYILKKKDAERLLDFLNSYSGTDIHDERIGMMEAEKERFLTNETAFGFFVDDKPYLTVAWALMHLPTKKIVTVDTGAVRFVSDGADVMAPGITEADENISEGDIVYITDEKNGRVIAVGKALVDGKKMIEGEKSSRKGKVIKNLHWAGDRIWKLTHG